MILGSKKPDEEDGEKEGNFFSMLTLLMNPFIIGFGIIAMRQMRKMHESTLSCYMNMSLAVIMVTLVFTTGSDFSILKDFSYFDWVFTVFMSLSVVISQRFKFMAFQNCQPSSLQSLSFMQTVIQFTADLILFNADFSTV